MNPIQGVFGGTFDPVHIGHLELGQWLISTGCFSVVRYLINHTPPHRSSPSAGNQERLAMLRLALKHEKCLIADDREIARGGVSYINDSLFELREELKRETPLALIVGSDLLSDIVNWHHFTQFSKLIHLVILERETAPVEMDSVQSTGMIFTTELKSLTECASGLVWLARQPTITCSSTEVRSLLTQNHQAKHLIPLPVWDYICQNHLYGVNPDGSTCDHGYSDDVNNH